MNEILIVEDERRMRDILRDYFTVHGCQCDTARNGEEALELLTGHDYDAVLLDVMMPGLDGFSVCRAVRRRSGVPVIFLTALYGEENMLYGYELGADDYVTKPFSLSVLYAKTMALIRRGRGSVMGGDILQCGPIQVDVNRGRCTVNGISVRLSPREYGLLVCLMRNKGLLLSRQQLLDKVWGMDFEGDERAVDVQIKNLRAALGCAGKQIETVIRSGYRLNEEVPKP
jgi:DNA-binding response OmpR family regulator